MDEPDRQAMRDAGRGHLLGEGGQRIERKPAEDFPLPPLQRAKQLIEQARAERLDYEAEHQTVWEIRESETGEFIGVVQASCATDALAEYALLSGYADPREADPDEGYFGLMPDASVSMVIENRTVYAVEQPPPS